MCIMLNFNCRKCSQRKDRDRLDFITLKTKREINNAERQKEEKKKKKKTKTLSSPRNEN